MGLIQRIVSEIYDEKDGKLVDRQIIKDKKIGDHIFGGTTKNGKRKSGTVENKIYSASTMKDRGKTIRAMTIVAAKKQQGMTSFSSLSS